jgi:hypothetical protein
MKYPINQSLELEFDLQLDPNMNVNNATSYSVGYRDSYGRLGTWAATINQAGNLYCLIPENTLAYLGTWAMWPVLHFPANLNYSGTPFIVNIVNPWENI